MIPYSIYNLLHLLGIFFVLVALAGISLHAANGGTRHQNKARRTVATFHGLSLVLVLVSGFGMLARLGITGGLPGWVWAKLVVWLLLGAAIVLPYRKPNLAFPLLVVIPLLALLSAYFAVYKPF